MKIVISVVCLFQADQGVGPRLCVRNDVGYDVRDDVYTDRK